MTGELLTIRETAARLGIKLYTHSSREQVEAALERLERRIREA